MSAKGHNWHCAACYWWRRQVKGVRAEGGGGRRGEQLPQIKAIFCPATVRFRAICNIMCHKRSCLFVWKSEWIGGWLIVSFPSFFSKISSSKISVDFKLKGRAWIYSKFAKRGRRRVWTAHCSVTYASTNSVPNCYSSSIITLSPHRNWSLLKCDEGR